MEVVFVRPELPLPQWLVKVVKRFLGWDLFEFFNTYPIWVRYPQADIYHFSSQNLASLLLFRKPPGPSVVTIQDLFPYMLDLAGVQQFPNIFARVFDYWSRHGLTQATALLAISDATRQSACEVLNIPTERITVIPLAVR